jgi:sugar fermentation stimulation protein A
MRFAEPLLRGTLMRRYKRFFADVVLDDGASVTAHCPNPGSMLSVASRARKSGCRGRMG